MLDSVRSPAGGVPETGRPVRVLINAIHAKSGGGVTYMRNILKPLAEDGRLDLHVLLHRSQDGMFEPMPPSVKVHLEDFPSGFLKTLLWEQWAVPRLARRLGAEVVFSPANYGPVLAPNPVILLRNALDVGRKEKRLTKKLYWWGLTLATAVSLVTARRAMAVSTYALDTLTFGGKRFTAKTRIVPHGVAANFSPPGADAAPRGDALLAVSDIYIQKNFHTLFEALARIVPERPELTLTIAGRILDADYHARLSEQLDRLGLAGRVTFLGGVGPEVLTGLYRSCRVFVFPSTVETFGNPLAEAMACGAPIATSAATAMPEVAGDAALLFDPEDPEDMARTLARLWDDADLRADLSAKAAKRGAEFSWVRCAADVADVLCDAAGRG